LEYFSNTRISTLTGPQPDKIDRYRMQEANTASLQVGGGYDSFKLVFGNFSVRLNSNLFGGAIGFGCRADRLLYQDLTSATRAVVLDSRSAVSLQVFYQQALPVLLSIDNAGGSINTSYPLLSSASKKLGPIPLDNVTAGLGYQLETSASAASRQFTPSILRVLRAIG